MGTDADGFSLSVSTGDGSTTGAIDKSAEVFSLSQESFAIHLPIGERANANGN